MARQFTAQLRACTLPLLPDDYTEWNDAKARLIAWGEANGETVSFSGTTLNINSRINVLPNSVGDDTNSAVIIITASILSITALGGYFVLRKKKIK